VIGAAALVTAGLLTLGGRGGNPPAAQHTRVTVAANRTPSLAVASAGQGSGHRSAPASHRAKPAPAVDACVVGTWTVAVDDLLNTINGSQVQFTGRGGYMVLRADGSGFENFDHEVMAATINGNSWTDVFAGTITMHVDTTGGAMYFSDVTPSANATWTLYENGDYNNSAPETLEPGADRYVCSGNTLRMFWSVGSSVLTRKLPRTS
jgi:hypothetical protein